MGRTFFGTILAIAILILLLNERDKRTNGAVWRRVIGWLVKGGLVERPAEPKP